MDNNKPFWWPEPQALIAIIMVISMVILAFVMIFRGQALPESDMLKMLIGGFMTTGFATIINYYFGSSRGSVNKDETINKMAANAEVKPAAADGKIVNTVGTVLLIAFCFSLFLAGSPASAQIRKNSPINLDPLGLTDRSSKSDPVESILGALDDKLLPDLQYALKLATASGSRVTAPCYQAWIDIITVRQKAVKAEDGTDLPMPSPAIITKFEKIVELRNSLQPDSEFMVKCSPVASMVKKDIVGFIGIVLSGGAGLATLVPGL